MDNEQKPKIIRSINEDRDYVHVRDLELDSGLRTVFIRLVPPHDTTSGPEIRTFDATDCYFDTDEEGNILGVTFTMFANE